MTFSRLLSAAWKHPKAKTVRLKAFSGWQLKEKIFGPVIVNLLTTFLIFIVIVAFRNPLYSYFFQSREHWPIFCILEPEVTNTGKITADLFVVNLDPSDYTETQLDKLASDESQNGSPLSARIQIYLTDSSSGKEILNVIPDDDFNKGKGSVIPKQVSPGHFEVRLDHINNRALLKLTIPTNIERPISSRSDYLTLPMAVSYFGHQ
jgi:hypothetical protein